MSSAMARVLIAALFSGALILPAASFGAEPEEGEARGLEDEDEEDDDEEETAGFLERIGLGVEADLEVTSERQGGDGVTEITFDEVQLTLERAWGRIEAGIKYETEGNKGVLVEEALFRLGGTDRWPWFVQIGKSVLPFADFDALFISDPLTVVVGETDQGAVVAGYESDAVEASVAAYRPDPPGDDDPKYTVSARVTALGPLRLGLSLSSDLGQSVELREIRDDRLEEIIGPGKFLDDELFSDDGVVGFGGSASFETGRVLAQLAHVAAGRTFRSGLLGETGLRPSAWNLEVGVHAAGAWLLAARVETSRDLPEHPKLQFGVAASYEVSEHVRAAAELLQGTFDGDEPNRGLAALQLAFQF